jgi:V/A-type H+-transporting ATPase subunit K
MVDPLVTADAVKYLAAALSIGLSGLGAGYAIAAAGSASIGAIAEKPELFGKTMIYVAFAEAIAIYGLLISLILLFVVGVPSAVPGA